MHRSAFFNFLFQLLLRHRQKHIAIMLIAAIVVFVLSSVMILAHAIAFDIKTTLLTQPDFVVQKLHGGNSTDTPLEWADEFAQIKGVTQALPRVYGRYYFEPDGRYCTIIGIDPFDTQTTNALNALVNDLNLSRFLAKPHMIVGQGVKAYFERYRFNKSYPFTTPHHSKIDINIYAELSKERALISNDLIIMPLEPAREILGIDDERATDIALYAPNPLEAEQILGKLIVKHFDTRVITKSALLKRYDMLFNYKGGIFLLLFIIVLLTFMIILYQRYSLVSSGDRKEIGIMRAVGWSIKSVIAFKLLEHFIVAFLAFALGFISAYLYVFYADAPLLGAIFYGFENLPSHFTLSHRIDWQLFTTIFLLYHAAFIAAVLLPAWRAAVTDPLEAMR